MARTPGRPAGVAVLAVPFLPLALEWLAASLTDELFHPDGGEVVVAVALAIGALIAAIPFTRSLTGASAAALGVTACAALLPAFAHAISELGQRFGLDHRLVSWGAAAAAAAAAGWLAWRTSRRLLRRAGIALTLGALTVAATGGVVVALAGVAASGHAAFHRPDVVLIVMDTARADHLSAYGYPRLTTPGIDRLAATSRVYERAMAPASWTPPSHASIFTGLLPAVHGTAGDFQVFDPPAPSLAELMQLAGYRTAAIVNNPNLDPSFGWDRGFERYAPTWSLPTRSTALLVYALRRPHEDWPWLGSTRRSFGMARRWWSEHGAEPKFLFLNLIDPHSPYGESHRYRDVFLDDETRRAPDISNDSEDYDAGIARAEGAALCRVVARYDGDLRSMDAEIERFLDWLETRGELDRTLIVLTSDHGERLGERGLLGHQLGLDHVLLHVPLIVRYPPRLEAGRIGRLVEAHGIFATVLDLVGLPTPADGLPRTAALDHQRLAETVAQMRFQRSYLREVRERNGAFDPTPYLGDWSSVYDGRWKLWSSSSGELRLFDLASDPAEAHDLAAAEPATVERLLPRVRTIPEFRRGREAERIDEELKQRLRSLGYVG